MKSYSMFSHNSLFKKVQWCIANDPSSYNIEKQRCVLKLRDTIFSIQFRLSIDLKYRVTKKENELVDKIIVAYQQDLIQEYFRGLAVNYKLSNRDYFIVTFQDFLERNKDKHTFMEEKKYIWKSQDELYNIYELTDLAVTLNKLYYITTLKALEICGQTTEEGKLLYIRMENAKKEIDTKTITFFRP